MGGFCDNRFDAAVSVHALHEIENPRAALREIHRVLRPDGILMVADFTDGETRWDEDYFTPGEVETMLRQIAFDAVCVEQVPGEPFMFATARKQCR